jgi:sugar transferase (PEP-CTERM/EpsH1 system associated)
MDEILFLAHRVPWPPDRGDKIRSYHILQHLRQMAPVHVGAFADDERDVGFTDTFGQHMASCHIELRQKHQVRAGAEALLTGRPVSVCSFASRSMRNWVDARLASGKIGHVYCFSGQMAQYVPADFTGRFVMDFVDVDSAKFESYAASGNPIMRWVNAREGRLLAGFEREVAHRADASLFVSKAEAELFARRSGAVNVAALENGIDTGFYDPAGNYRKMHPAYPDPLIIFTGQMDYRPNVEAVTAFATDTMPIIRQNHPDATFAIVGRNPTPAVYELSALPGVQVTGAVDDVRTWLSAADVVVAPLRTARGIQNKVLEAMAMAKPVIASPAAAEGIDAQSGLHFFVEDSPANEAHRICALLAQPDLMQQVGRAARAHVTTRYSWAGQLSSLGGIMHGGPDIPILGQL